jgi:CRP-like cAMP-binding protein
MTARGAKPEEDGGRSASFGQSPAEDVRTGNAVLDCLSPDQWRAAAACMTRKWFRKGTILQRGRTPVEHLYFPIDCLISLRTWQNSCHLQTAMVGRDGYVGLASVFGWSEALSDAEVLVPGEAWIFSIRENKAMFDDCLRIHLLRYAGDLYRQCSERAVVAGTAGIDVRLAHWLLEAVEKGGRINLPMTHATLATLLAVRRATVTTALRRLQKENVITLRRRVITIADPEGLSTRVGAVAIPQPHPV